jgi:hypothetical protein
VMQEKQILKGKKKLNPREKNPSILSIYEAKQQHSKV